MVIVRREKEGMQFLQCCRCSNFENGIQIRLQGTDAVLIDSEAGDLKFCGANLRLLIVVRRISLLEFAEKIVEFSIVVSIAIGDDNDDVERIYDSGETMSNLADNRLEAGCRGTQHARDPFPLIDALRSDHLSDVTHRRIQLDLPVSCFQVEFGELSCTCEDLISLSIMGSGFLSGISAV